MPTHSEAQRRAMQAATGGRSSLGIPQQVGREYTHADALRRSSGAKPPRPPYGNYTESYGNDTRQGTHHTHWRQNRRYGGSNVGGASVGGGT